MNSDIILSHINEYVRLNEAETEALTSVLISRPYKQGELIVRGGEPARYMMYVNTGYLMTYYTDKGGLDRVIQLAGGGWWSGDIFSLTNESSTLYSTKGLCSGEVLLLPRLAQQHLLEKYVVFERYFRILFQYYLIRQQMRFVEGYSTPAEERYETFINKYPGVEKHVPQKYIASYLGITPEFLSKLRKKSLRR